MIEERLYESWSGWRKDDGKGLIGSFLGERDDNDDEDGDLCVFGLIVDWLVSRFVGFALL